MGGTIKLHLGCGHHYWPGFVNIDAQAGDVQTDIRTLSGYQATEIHAIHLIEHLNRWEVPEILKRWKENLAPGGKIFLECPDLEKVLTLGRDDMLRGLFGDFRYRNEYMNHRWCYSGEELAQLCREAGFVDVQIKPPLFHKPRRDMRIEAKRADH